MLIWVMFDCKYKLDQIGVRYHKLEEAKEKKIGVEPQSSKLDSKAKTPKLKIEESNQSDGDPGNWINCPESDRSSRLQFLKNLVNWMVIQVTGLINPYQAESPGDISMKIQSIG